MESCVLDCEKVKAHMQRRPQREVSLPSRALGGISKDPPNVPLSAARSQKRQAAVRILPFGDCESWWKCTRLLDDRRCSILTHTVCSSALALSTVLYRLLERDLTEKEICTSWTVRIVSRHRRPVAGRRAGARGRREPRHALRGRRLAERFGILRDSWDGRVRSEGT